MITIPKGTTLYRGCWDKDQQVVGTESTMYFTQSKIVAKEYSKNGCFVTIIKLADIQLLDLSTEEAWKRIDAVKWVANPEKESYKGVKYETDNRQFIELTEKSGLFPDGVVESPPCPNKFEPSSLMRKPPPPKPQEICKTMKWHGLLWGPLEGQFKRHSDLGSDLVFLEELRKKCKEGYPDLCAEGIYAPPLPAPRHVMMDEEKDHRGVFHDEIALFGVPAEKFQLVAQGARRKKTLRRKLKYKKRTRKHGS